MKCVQLELYYSIYVAVWRWKDRADRPEGLYTYIRTAALTPVIIISYYVYTRIILIYM